MAAGRVPACSSRGVLPVSSWCCVWKGLSTCTSSPECARRHSPGTAGLPSPCLPSRTQAVFWASWFICWVRLGSYIGDDIVAEQACCSDTRRPLLHLPRGASTSPSCLGGGRWSCRTGRTCRVPQLHSALPGFGSPIGHTATPFQTLRMRLRALVGPSPDVCRLLMVQGQVLCWATEEIGQRPLSQGLQGFGKGSSVLARAWHLRIGPYERTRGRLETEEDTQTGGVTGRQADAGETQPRPVPRDLWREPSPATPRR